MFHRHLRTTAVITSAALGFVGGCESLPGDEEGQGAVAGGVVGAVAGAAIAGEDNRLLGALIGGALGAGGGYLIGAYWDKLTGKEKEEAIQAGRDAEANPADAADVKGTTTADLNSDGFVTLDEVVAMEKAGLSDQEMTKRLRATNQYFELTSQQELYLRDRGVSNDVVLAMRQMTEESQRLASERMGDDPISRDPK
ncbi:MAG: glycine zipper 2TM domain-containing protein [Dehalococcoidia bacterium]